MALKDYSSIYTIEDWMLHEVAPKFYEMENVSTLNTGLFGMNNHIIGSVIEDQFEVVDRYVNEMLPQKANLPEFIYANAALYGITSFLARPAKTSMLLYLKEKDILEKSVYKQSGRTIITSGKSSYAEYRNFIIDSEMLVFTTVYGDKASDTRELQFSIPYDINIQVSEIDKGSNVKEYSYIATWIMDTKNEIAEVANPYIKLYRSVYDGDIWIALKIDIYQYARREYTNQILTNSRLNIPYFERNYSDQLCNFEVFYQEPGSDEWVQLEKRLESSTPVSTPFIYYKVIDEETVRFSFANDDRYFVPDYNSNIKVHMYETVGKDGNFFMTDETGIVPTITLRTNDEDLAYNRAVIAMGLIGTDSIGGRSKLTVQDIKDLTCAKMLTVDSITTDNDLVLFAKNYAAVYQTNPVFIKYRDDVAGREYGCYIRLTDGVDIYPSNTVNLKITSDAVDKYFPSLKQYIIKPGKRYKYDSGKTNDTVIPMSPDEEKADIEYTSIFLTIVQTKPNSVRYYLNTVDKNVMLEYTDINSFSFYNFLVSSCSIKRNAVRGDMSYLIKLSILRVDGVIEGINVDDDINSSEDLDKKLRVLIIFETNEGHYVEMSLVSMNKKIGQYDFEATIETDDMIDTSRISLLNLKNSDTGAEESRIVDMMNPKVHFCVFYKYETDNIVHKYQDVTTIKDYTLCNSYSPYENEFYFALPMELMRSHVTFLDIPGSPSGFGFNVKQTPLLGYDFIFDEESNHIAEVTQEIVGFYDFIYSTLMSVTPNFTINIKLFNTYGRSKMFYVGEERLLDYVNLRAFVKIRFYAGVDEGVYLNHVKMYIKDFVENLNIVKEGTNKIESSVLIHKLHEEFKDQIEYIILPTFNDYGAEIQVIELNGLLPSETTPDTVPEFVTLRREDITIISI